MRFKASKNRWGKLTNQKRKTLSKMQTNQALKSRRKAEMRMRSKDKILRSYSSLKESRN
jgi:hypothetical protein